MPEGKSWRTSLSSPQARAAGPTSPRADGGLARDRSGPLEPSLDRQRVPEQVGRAGDVAVRRVQTIQTLFDPVVIQIESDPAGPDQAAAEAAAAQEGGQVEEIAPDPPAVRGGRQEPDVAGQGPRSPV